MTDHRRAGSKFGRLPYLCCLSPDPAAVRPPAEVSRRLFLQQLTAVGAAGLLAGRASAQRQSIRPMDYTGRLVQYTSPQLCLPDGTVQQEAVAAALDASVCRLVGAHSADQAWKSLFDPGEVVGLKVSCQAGRELCTHPALVTAVAQRLQSIGVAAENIIIWDRKDAELKWCGFELNSGARGVKCMGSDSAGGYDRVPTESAHVATCLSRLQSTVCDCIINMPVLKDHLIAGVTAAMKNYFGSIDNPNKYHSSCCDPYIADVYALPSVRGKERLIICDALQPAFSGGPAYNRAGVWRANTLLVGKDPVALDYVGWYMVDKQREAAGLRTLTAEKRQPHYIYTAAAAGLGVSDPTSTNLIRLGADDSSG